MRKVLFALLVLVLTVSLAFAAKLTKKDVSTQVDKAAAYLKKEGKDKAFAEINKKDGMFTDRSKELYVFVFDMSGKCLAHGENPGLIGKDLSGLKDKNDKYFIKDMIAAAKKGSGWVNYQWTNPATKKIEPKASYVKSVPGNMFVGSGLYNP